MNCTDDPVLWAGVKTAVADELRVEEAEIGYQTRLVEDLGVDSLDMAGLLVALEDFFIAPPDAEAVRCARHVGDLYVLVAASREAQ